MAVFVQNPAEPAGQDTIPRAVLPDSLVAPVVPEYSPLREIPSAFSVEDYLTLKEVQDPDSVVVDTIEIWQYRFAAGFEEGETDSTLRWKNYLNLFDRFYQERGAVTYRMGTVGRMDGMELHGYETRHLNLEMEGLAMNDPLTGAVDWNRLPIHKIDDFREAGYGATYRSQTRLKDHYLTKPRTYLNFDESKYNFRSLEFAFIQNVTQTTNVELSFWDRRDGGGYPRSGIEGRQIMARIYHQLNERWLLKAAYLNNGLDREESFGYLTEGEDPRLYHFNRFMASANQSSAVSNKTSNDLYIQAHHRKDKNSRVSTELGLHYQGDQLSLRHSADTLGVGFRKMELFGRQHIRAGPVSLGGTGRMFMISESEKENLSESGWMGGSGEADLTWSIAPWSRLHGYASLTAWDDNRTSNELSGKLEVNPAPGVSLSGFAGLLSRAPDIQAKYWQAEGFAGNDSLANEISVTAGAGAEVRLGPYFSAGVRGDIRNTESAVFVDGNGNFRNIAPYSQISGTGWLGLNSDIFEGEVSATYKTFNSSAADSVNQQLNASGDRVWLKGHLYWKNYLFDRATYVTAGLSGVFSPNSFGTAEFISELNRWQHGTNTFANPSYYRLDLDVSARIRWFMVLLKYENVLDQVNQLGYFESTGYPMPGRRFTFGIRVIFTN